MKAVKEIDFNLKNGIIDLNCSISDDCCSNTDEENEVKNNVQLKSSLEGFMNLNHVSCATNIFESSLKTILDSKESKIREIKSSVLKFVVSNTRSTKKTEALKVYTPKILIKFAETRWNRNYFNEFQQILSIF